MTKHTTIKMDELKAEANKVFQTSTNEFALQRKGIFAFVETILMANGAYKGFSYLTKDQVGENMSYGIEPNYETGVHTFPDETRVSFY